MQKKKLYDIIGIACGLILLLVLIVSHVQANNSQKLDLPGDAQTLTASAEGKEGPVEVEVIASPDQIFKVRVTNHTETDGIGTNAVDQIPNAIVEAQSLAVDSVSGATITSDAIKNAVATAMTEAGIDPAAFGYEAPAAEEAAAEAPAEEPAEEAAPAEAPAAAPAEAPAAAGDTAYVPGTYTAEATGMSNVVVNVTVDEGAITAVEIDGSGETPGIGLDAIPTLSDQVLAAQSAEIDGVAGATITSTAVRTAVAAALAEATAGGETAEEPAEETAAAEPAEEPEAAPAEGGKVTLTGIGQGMGGDVEVQIVADESTIYSVEVIRQNETPGIGSIAVEQLPDAIVAANTFEVDGVAGATLTSTAIRNAIKTALEEAGFDPAAYGAATEPAAEAEETAAPAEDRVYDVDVVVVGAGGAGMTAAITAADAGKTVLVLESQAMVGGNSVRSTGGMNAGPTEWRNANEFGESAGVESTLAKVANYPDNARIQELGAIVAEQWAAYQENPEGYFDTAELFQLDTLIGGGGMNDPALVKRLVENSPDAIAWLDQLDPAVVLHNVAQFGGASVKRIHRPVDADGKVLSVGAYVVPLLKQNLENRGIEVLLNTTATEILMDSGTAVGVAAESADGAKVTVNAQSVVIASGGFGANNDMIASIRPELDGFITTNAPGIQGQGIQMAQAVGADTVDLEQIQLHPTVHVQDGSAVLITEGLRGDGAILVNQEGERFFDEVSTRDKVSAAEFEQTGGYAWLIVDSRMSDASNVIQGYISKGYAESGETYEALAEAIGAPADAFAATMEKWNACVEAKEDADFGRVSFANPLDQAPYYAIKVQPGVHHTMGGIRINDAAQVISTDGEVISGLFAAGEVTGGVHGNNRLGGNAVADFVIFGRIAGSSAAGILPAAEPAEEAAPAEEASPAEEPEAAPAEGGKVTLTGIGQGMGGDVEVQIVADESTIYSVEVIRQNETPGIGSIAVEQLPDAIVAANTFEVDGVAGATLTSTAIRNAIKTALEEAGFDPAAYGAAA